MKTILNMFCLVLGLVLSSGCAREEGDPASKEAKKVPGYDNLDCSAAPDVSPPASGYASDDWLTNGTTPWSEEMRRRDQSLHAYLCDKDTDRSRKYGFRSGHTPALAWNWFDKYPVGYNGVPYVLLNTILSLNPATETDPHLAKLANIWKKPSVVPDEQGKNRYTIDHLGFGPHPEDYENGIAIGPGQRKHLLPNGFVYDPEVAPKEVHAVDERLRFMRDGAVGQIIRRFADHFGEDYDPRVGKLLVLARGKIRKTLYGDEIDYETEHERFQKAPRIDAVFLSCSACHQGRVIVGGQMDNEGNILEQGQMKFLPGMPNTEIEEQYYSRLLMETGLALIESGFSIDATALPKPDAIVPNQDAVTALYTRMISRALDPNVVKTIYGADPDRIRRAKLQTYWTAKDFPTHLGDLIGVAVKTQYIYYQIANKYAFNPDNPRKNTPDQKMPDVITDRIGQMDAFGIASGLVALHTLRPDNSFLEFLYRDNPDNPLFAGIPTAPGFNDRVDPAGAAARIRDTLKDWAPPVPGPIDIKSLNWTAHRELANWDGNQGAAARTLASGTSATGDPRKVNVRIHEPLNPLINNMPPPPYPFDIDKEKALQGMAIYEKQCSGCHKPNNAQIYPAGKLGVDENRALVTTEVSRYGMAGLVMEACKIFIRNNPGNDWCLPRDKQGQVITDWETANDDYFKDTPARVRNGTHGYKADMLHGIWAGAPYLHNGSVPTLMHLVCPSTRPKEFRRGIIFYDREMVGFEWLITPRQRYSLYETQLVKTFDTSVFGRSATGHEYGSRLCPDTSGLDPIADREEIKDRVSASEIGDLLEYLKTL